MGIPHNFEAESWKILYQKTKSGYNIGGLNRYYISSISHVQFISKSGLDLEGFS